MREGLGTRLESSHIPTPGNKAIKSTDASGLSIFRDSYMKNQPKTVSLNYIGSYPAKLGLILLYTSQKLVRIRGPPLLT